MHLIHLTNSSPFPSGRFTSQMVTSTLWSLANLFAYFIDSAEKTSYPAFFSENVIPRFKFSSSSTTSIPGIAYVPLFIHFQECLDTFFSLSRINVFIAVWNCCTSIFSIFDYITDASFFIICSDSISVICFDASDSKLICRLFFLTHDYTFASQLLIAKLFK